MRKEVNIIIFVIITMTLNILAPILTIKMVRDYTKQSFIIGSPDNTVVVNNYAKKDNYLFQENLSTFTFIQEGEFYVLSYNFEPKNFDIKKSYAIFVNDYICTPNLKTGKAFSGSHVLNFNDINNQILNTTKITIDFEFYNTYSSVLMKVETTDIQYFNGFRKNPGLIITLSEMPNYEGILDICTVSFIDNDSLLTSRYVERFNYLTVLPETPTKSGYRFIGWSIDGETKIDPLTVKIQDDTIFYTLFEKE